MGVLPYSDQIGPELLAMRTNLGLSRQDVADEMGISPASLLNWEHGKHIMQLDSFFRLCVAYGEMPSEVIRRIELRVVADAGEIYNL